MAQTLTSDLLAQLFRLDGKVALVAGGYGGIGAAISEALAAVGARVAVSGRSADKAHTFADRLKSMGYDAYGTTFDVVKVEEVRRMVDEVAGHFSRLDILINCVGLNREEKAEDV